MICPHCETGVGLNLSKGSIHKAPDFDTSSMGYQVATGVCPVCRNLIVLLYYGSCSLEGKRDTIFNLKLGEILTEQVIYPQSPNITVAEEVPENYKKDFQETFAVLSISAKASATLSRRLLQKILREHFKISQKDLSLEIEEFIKTKGAPAILNDDIDAIRNIGNFAAHPLKSTRTGEIIDVEPGEAEWLIEVLEALFEFAFVQPTKHEERRKRLNDKLHDAGKPPMKKK